MKQCIASCPQNGGCPRLSMVTRRFGSCPSGLLRVDRRLSELLDAWEWHLYQAHSCSPLRLRRAPYRASRCAGRCNPDGARSKADVIIEACLAEKVIALAAGGKSDTIIFPRLAPAVELECCRSCYGCEGRWGRFTPANAVRQLTCVALI